MCTSDLDEELERGDEAARLLVEHLQAMRAENVIIPVWLDGEHYVVTAEIKKDEMK